MLYGIDGVQDCVSAVLLIDGERRIDVLHLVSRAVIPQERVTQGYSLRRKSNGRVCKQVMKLDVTECGGCRDRESFTANLNKFIRENKCRAYLVTHV
jgi:hypothetical protein